VGQVIHDHGLQFGCSVFSLDAVALLTQVPELDIWKIPSGVSEWRALGDAVRADGRPVWESCGLSDDAHACRQTQAADVAMNCTSLYPCPASLSGLGWAERELIGSRWGWSDHTGDAALIYAAIGAGARVVEVHLELGHESTPDTVASWTPARLTELVEGIRRIEQGLASTDKNMIAAAVAHLRPYYVPTRYQDRVAKWQGQGEAV
jgi:sialic acid synthase SpsE